MRFVKIALIVAASVEVVACGGGSGCGMGAMADTTGWQVVDAGPFVFKLPRGYADEMPQGIDSYIGRWRRGGRWVSFDHGQYTRDPRDSYLTGPDDRLCTTRIHGRGVVLQESEPVAQDGRRAYVLSGWWRGRSPDGPLYA